MDREREVKRDGYGLVSLAGASRRTMDNDGQPEDLSPAAPFFADELRRKRGNRGRRWRE